eukprot:1812685-Pyramimonas_sp.AAC.1
MLGPGLAAARQLVFCATRCRSSPGVSPACVGQALHEAVSARVLQTARLVSSIMDSLAGQGFPDVTKIRRA